MPGARGWLCHRIGIVGRLDQGAAEHALDLARAAGRRGAAASASRSIRRWWIRRRPRPRRHRRSDRSGPQGRFAHAPPWSAKHGPTNSPKAPRPVRRRRAKSCRATGCAGTRIATVSSPAVARSATGAVFRFGQHQRQRPRPERLGQRGRQRVETADPPGGRRDR